MYVWATKHIEYYIFFCSEYNTHILYWLVKAGSIDINLTKPYLYVYYVYILLSVRIEWMFSMFL